MKQAFNLNSLKHQKAMFNSQNSLFYFILGAAQSKEDSYLL